MFFAIRLELNEWFQEPTWRVYKGSLFSPLDQICQKRNCESFDTFCSLIQFNSSNHFNVFHCLKKIKRLIFSNGWICEKSD